MSGNTGKTLVIGYGNPGRRDDGLGPAFAEAIEKLGLAGLTVEVNYQLGVEDAHALANHRGVVFADAAAEGPEPFSFRPIEPKARMSFSSHSLDPASVLALARDLFEAETVGYLLGIRGYVFDEFNESLTPQAERNLAAALVFFQSWMQNGSFSQTAESISRLASLFGKEGK